jgi:hypothetical protein
MKKPYLTWWYPSFSNPDNEALLESVHLCTVDNEINLFFKARPPGFPKMIDLAIAFRESGESRLDARDDADGKVLVLRGGGQKITIDEIAGALDLLAKLASSLDSKWFHDRLAEDKKLAGLKPDEPSDYDVRNCSTPDLQRITCSKYGGTITLKETSRKAKETLLAIKREDVQFFADPENPLNIRFTWDTPIIAVGRDRPEYLSMQQIFSVLHPVMNVSQDLYAMRQQVAGVY